MDLTTLSQSLLSALALYGAPILAATVLVGTLGLPLPSTTLLIAAGALTRVEGVNPVYFILATLLAAVIGDSAGYLLGRHLGGALPERITRHPRWDTAVGRFSEQGWGALYLSRWLLTPLAVPLNVVAGASGYRSLSFLSAEVAGDITWILLYGGAGYLLGAQWQAASVFVDSYGSTIALWTMATGALWFVAKRYYHGRSTANVPVESV